MSRRPIIQTVHCADDHVVHVVVEADNEAESYLERWPWHAVVATADGHRIAGRAFWTSQDALADGIGCVQRMTAEELTELDRVPDHVTR